MANAVLGLWGSFDEIIKKKQEELTRKLPEIADDSAAVSVVTVTTPPVMDSPEMR